MGDLIRRQIIWIGVCGAIGFFATVGCAQTETPPPKRQETPPPTAAKPAVGPTFDAEQTAPVVVVDDSSSSKEAVRPPSPAEKNSNPPTEGSSTRPTADKHVSDDEGGIDLAEAQRRFGKAKAAAKKGNSVDAFRSATACWEIARLHKGDPQWDAFEKSVYSELAAMEKAVHVPGRVDSTDSTPLLLK